MSALRKLWGWLFPEWMQVTWVDSSGIITVELFGKGSKRHREIEQGLLAGLVLRHIHDWRFDDADQGLACMYYVERESVWYKLVTREDLEE